VKRGTSLGLLYFALLFAAAALPRPAHSDAMKEVSCSEIGLKYGGTATKTKCLQLDQVGNQTEVEIQRLIVDNATNELIVSYYASKFRTYLPLESLRQIVNGNRYFAETENWQAIHKYAGFEIAAFNGLGKSGDAPILCAGFARFSGEPGNYEFDGGPGYKNLTEGIYCVSSGGAALISPIDNFYSVVDGVIGKLQLPQ
jgi:hypothetical protein